MLDVVAEVILIPVAHGIPASLTAVLCFCCTPLLLGAVRDALWVWLKCHDGTGSALVWSREASKNRVRAARWAQERAAEAQTAFILCLICLPFNAPLSASSPLHPSPEEKAATTWKASLFGGDTVGGLSHQYFIFAVRQHVLMMTSVWMAENSIMETLTLEACVLGTLKYILVDSRHTVACANVGNFILLYIHFYFVLYLILFWILHILFYF